MSLLNDTIIFLSAAVITVPICKRLGLGSVLGYLAAGMLIGPSGLGLIHEIEDTRHFAELGVVLLLFIIGLELQPARLWVLRKPIFGLGSLQVLLTAIALFGVSLALGLPWHAAIVIGLCLSLSSTAFALQMLAEKKQLLSYHGRTAFAILLFQDLAVIPMLAIIPLLGGNSADTSLLDYCMSAGKATGIILLVVIAGHYLIRPILRLIAVSRNHEIFSAASLLVVIGTAALMEFSGLSMALGAFLAGVLLADSEFRHELEANIEPFKGLLLGLFFISVGMSVDLHLVINKPLLLLALSLGLIAIKGSILFSIAKLNKQNHASALNLAIIICQGGEFAFVLLGVASLAQLINQTLVDMIIVIVTLSMMMTPILFAINEFSQAKFNKQKTDEQYDDIDADEPKVIIAGFGRFGQIVARILRMKKIAFTALESSFDQVDFVRKFGNKIYFGDASRLELLRAAQADKADVLVIAIVDVETSIKTAEVVKKNFPHLKIFARARNRQHTYRLMDAGVDYVIRETFLSSVELAKNVLQGLGYDAAKADNAANAFKDYDQELMQKQYAIYHDEEKLIASAKEAAAELQSLFEEDTGTDIDKSESLK